MTAIRRNDYVFTLRKEYRLSPGKVKRRHHDRVRSRVRSNGVPVPTDWKPSDKTGFLKAAKSGPMTKAQSELATGLTKFLPAFAGSTPPDTTSDFMRDKQMQALMLNALGYTCITSGYAKAVTAAAFKTEFYDREVECLVDRHEQEDGDLEAGSTAQRALLVPFMALVFSLMGALAHMAKLTLYVLTLIKGYPLFKRSGRFAMITLALPALLVTMFAWSMSSATTNSKAFQGLERDAGLVMRTLIRGSIHGQMLGYPIFEAVRVHALRGFEFGYGGADATDRNEAGTPSADGDIYPSQADP